MIFLTVGSMLPFDRLVRCVDEWAAGSSGEEVFAQIGVTSLRPSHMEWVVSLSPSEYRRKMRDARLLISHVGMGTIITAMETRKPIVVLPRRAAYREVTTDHQLATALWLRDKPGVFVAESELAIPALIASVPVDYVVESHDVCASPQLLERVRSFIEC